MAHFFVFLLSVWGELSPPTSLTAAVSARIAEASFMRTMWEALKICLPITLMTFAIFTRSNMVVTTGWPQIMDTLAGAGRTCGIAFAMFGCFVNNRAADIALRLLLAAVSFVAMFHPDDNLALVVGVILLPALLLGIWRHRLVAPPPPALEVPADPRWPLSLMRCRRHGGGQTRLRLIDHSGIEMTRTFAGQTCPAWQPRTSGRMSATLAMTDAKRQGAAAERRSDLILDSSLQRLH